MVDRKSLIAGAALAVLYQLQQAEIAGDRSKGCFNPEHQKYLDFQIVQDCIAQGLVPQLERVSGDVKHAMAHLRQSMRVDYDEWFAIFPWLVDTKK